MVPLQAEVQPETLSPTAVTHLQRTIGNRAVGELIQPAIQTDEQKSSKMPHHSVQIMLQNQKRVIARQSQPQQKRQPENHAHQLGQKFLPASNPPLHFPSVSSISANPPIQRFDPEDESEDGDQVVQVKDGETVAREENLDKAYWEYEPAEKPVEVLINEGYRREHDDALEMVEDIEGVYQNMRGMKKTYDPEHELVPQDTMTEFNGRVSLFRSTYNDLLGQVPSTQTREDLKDELFSNDYEYQTDWLHDRIVKTPESRRLWNERKAALEAEERAVERQIKEVDAGFIALRKNIWEAREEMRPHVKVLAEAESSKFSEDYGGMYFGFAPLLSGENKEHFLNTYLPYVNDNLEALEKVADGPSRFSGASLGERRVNVMWDAADYENVALIGNTRLKVRMYIDGDFNAKFADMGEAIWDEGNGGFTFSERFKNFEDGLRDELTALEDLQDEFIGANPFAANGMAYASAVDAKIASINKKMNNFKAQSAPIARSLEIIEEMEIEVSNLLTHHRAEKESALPNLQPALVHLITIRKLEAEQTELAKRKAALEGGHTSGDPEGLEKRQTSLANLPAEVAANVGSSWYSYTADLEQLRNEVKKGVKDGRFTENDLKSAESSLNMAELLNDYTNWYDLINAARGKIMEREASAKRTEDLKKLNDFEKRVAKSFTEDLQKLIDPDSLKTVRDRLEDINKDIKIFTAGEIEGGDFEKKVAKTVNQEFWKRVKGSKNDWAKKLGTLHETVSKGTEKVDKLISAHDEMKRILSVGDSVPLSRGAKHPAIEGLAGALSVANEFNKVPIFKDLVGFYITALEGISKNMAYIEQKVTEQKLQLMALGYEVGGDL